MHKFEEGLKIHSLKKNSIRDARTPQPVEIVFNTISCRSSDKVQRSGYFHSSVSYIKVQIILSIEKQHLRERKCM